MSTNCKTEKKKQSNSEMCQFKWDTESNGNQMPIGMHMMFFMQAKNNELNKSISENSVLHLQ